MDEKVYKLLALRENFYWWHFCRRELVVALVKKFSSHTLGKFLDLGCGTGGNFLIPRKLQFDLLVGIDISDIALQYASANYTDAIFIKADLNQRLPLKPNSFDLITVFNVLYHSWVNNEQSVINEIHRLLQPGGLFIITEPAFPCLYRQMDIRAMGRKRYMSEEIDSLCKNTGFQIIYSTHITLLGYFVIRLSKHFKRNNVGSDELDSIDISFLANLILKVVAKFENWIILRGVRLPYGTTYLCVCKKLVQ